MAIVLLKLRSFAHKKKRKTKLVTRTPSSGISSPNFHDGPHLGHFMEIAKNLEFW